MLFRGLSVVLFHLFLWVLLIVAISIPVVVVVVLVLLPIVVLLVVLLLLVVVGGSGALVAAGPTGLGIIFSFTTLWVVSILVKIFLGILLSHFPARCVLRSLLY
jgi:hypothetical protein